MRKRWEQRPANSDTVTMLVRNLGIRRTTARILAARELLSVDAAQRFLSPSFDDLHDPFLLPDMERAVDRIRRAIAAQERILVAGDYDVDGITATAVYLELFASLGTRVSHRIPHRMTEGYGLTDTGVRAAHEQKASLIITADCGTTAQSAIELANSLGIDVIVTDHHEPREHLPPAYAILNPHVPGSRYPEKVLCAAGIAFKVGQALLGTPAQRATLDDRLASLLDLVALGTVADVAPLRGENRFFVREGLRLLTRGLRPGIAALKTICGLEGKPVDAATVGFQLAPRINAVGRLADADTGVSLLTCTDPASAIEIARVLDAANKERRRIEDDMLEGAIARMQYEIPADARSVVLADPTWHPGVIGIIASRLVDRWHRPTVVLAVGDGGIAKGSGRSVPGFHLTRALEDCRDLFVGFGGHAAAAGLSIKAEHIPAFRSRFEAVVASTLSADLAQPILSWDDEVPLEEITFPLLEELARLAPFGPGNPEPLLTTRGCAPRGARIVGNNHLKMHVQHVGPSTFDAIGFGLGHLLPTGPGTIDLAYAARVDTWQGRHRIQLRLKDLRSGDTSP